MKVLAIAGLGLRRLVRERANIFWIVIAPLLFVFVLGLMSGAGSTLRIGVLAPDEPLSHRLATALADTDEVTVTTMTSEAALRTAVERGTVHAGLLLPASYDADLRAGRPVTVTLLARPDDPAAAGAGSWIRTVVPREAAGADPAPLPDLTVDLTTTGANPIDLAGNPFGLSAPSMLLLFIFLTSLTSALGLIEARRLGLTRRAYATPTSPITLVIGEALARFGVAAAQGLVIMLGSALLFGVDWGDPLGAAAVLTTFCLVGAGAAMVLGATLRTEGTALGVALALGLGLSAIGGSMVPVDQLGEPVQTLARFTPHAWAGDAFSDLLWHGAGVTGVALPLAVLAGYAAVLFLLGGWQLRRALTR